jgi:hypothetical protein
MERKGDNSSYQTVGDTGKKNVRNGASAQQVKQQIRDLETSLRALRTQESTKTASVNTKSIAAIDSLLSTLLVNVDIVSWE